MVWILMAILSFGVYIVARLMVSDFEFPDIEDTCVIEDTEPVETATTQVSP